MERSFRSFKVETQHHHKLKSPGEMIWITRKYIRFYNTRRIHLTNGNMPFSQFEQSTQQCA
jgi:transposase InsO family protein